MISFIAGLFEDYRRCASKKYASDPWHDYNGLDNPFRNRTRSVAIAWLLVGVGVLTVLLAVAMAIFAGYVIAPVAAFIAVLVIVGYIVVDLLRWVRSSDPERKDTRGRQDVKA